MIYRLPALLSGMTFALVLAAGCPGQDAVIASVNDSGSGATGAAGSGGSTGGSSAGGDDLCAGVNLPGVPNGATPGGEIRFVAALKLIDFGEEREPGDPLIGHNIDGDPPGGMAPLCKPPKWDSWDPNKVLDDICGRDNATARFMASASLTFETLTKGLKTNPFKSSVIIKAINDGKFSVLFRVAGYNGEANDDEVSVSIYASPGFEDDTCPGAADEPSWDGADRWPLGSMSFEGAGSGGAGSGGAGSGGAGSGGSCAPFYDPDLSALKPLHTTDAAHVSEGRLVADLGTGLFVIPAEKGTIQVDLEHAIVAATIREMSDGWRLEGGLLTGVWRTRDLLRSLGGIRATEDKICDDSSMYSILKGMVCNHIDISSAKEQVAGRCDALSFGVAFETHPAKLGRVIQQDDTLEPCASSQAPPGDDCDDSGAGGSGAGGSGAGGSGAGGSP